ncbi:hypothetical protein Slin_6916 (plasmid) [Spirosoma linguale DSM 74]|uniref:Uncharacterized protein n=1 Tax=Spirosoma linguale (strain ATCC 33905 / DSM 74 / LMG 10896 / Claus 1) TaxID=504472 RepID=D2QVN0_SPILD|nr:hypothetical protein Slin_6916 [Spirosoma linguale DSM 74]
MRPTSLRTYTTVTVSYNEKVPPPSALVLTDNTTSQNLGAADGNRSAEKLNVYTYT